MARRRIERLQGVQFCRRTMEIRSEVSCPPDLFRPAWLENWSISSLLLSGIRAGWGYGRMRCAFSHACSALLRRNNPSARPPSTDEPSHGGLCPHPPRNLRFLGFSFCCRFFGRTDASPQSIGASRDHRGTAPSVRTSPAPETQTQRSSRRPPARRPRRLNAAATACRLSLPGRRWRGLGF